MTPTCPNCGATVPGGARFCPSCGAPLAGEGPGDERRVVTVVFGDLVGFTALSEARDPEAVKNLVDNCFARLAADVEAFGGRVDKVVGDAIVALFGAPVTHEDDAERAVRAALAMQETVTAHAAERDLPIRLRIGVNTGEVLVGSIQAGDDYTAMGDVVNTASRLQSAADPGTVLVGAATRAATGDAVEYEAHDPVEAKGKHDPVAAWVATGTANRPGRRPRRERTPLVGRDTEMQMLTGSVETAFAHGRGQFVLILGEAGIGKSRLARELIAHTSSRHQMLVVEGGCVPYGETNPWWPIAEALQDFCGLERFEAAEVVRERMHALVGNALAKLGTDQAEVERRVDGLLYLMGHPDALADLDAERAMDEAVRALRTLLMALTTVVPVVVCLTDLHWADPQLLNLLDRLMESMRSLRIVFVATARPELVERWNPVAGRRNVLVSVLDPLRDEDTETLLDTLLPDTTDTALRAALRDRSGGNPLYAEEFAALLETATAADPNCETPTPGTLPATLHGLVAARVDALDPALRSLVADAAVIGHDGSLEALDFLAASRGDTTTGPLDLEVHDVLRVDSDGWAFRSDLVREVAYGMLTKADRARRHAVLGEWLTDRRCGDETCDEDSGLIAHHLATAAELVGEIGATAHVGTDIVDRALDELERAADIAIGHNAISTAEHMLDHALRILPDEAADDRTAHLQIMRAGVRSTMRRLSEAREDAEAALETARVHARSDLVVRALTSLGEIAQRSGDTDAALEMLDEAIGTARRDGEAGAAADALRAKGMTLIFKGDTAAADEAITEALSLYRAEGDGSGEAWAYQHLAMRAFFTNRLDEAARYVESSLEYFETVGDYTGIAWGQGLLAFVKLREGDLVAAEAIATPVLDDARDGDRWAFAMMLDLLAGIHLWTGRGASGIELAEESRAVFTSIGDKWGMYQATLLMCRALAATGRLDELATMEAELESQGEAVEDPATRSLGLMVRMMVAVQLGDIDRVTAALAEKSVDSGAEFVLAETCSAQALAELQLGRVEQALELVHEAVARATTDGDRAYTSAVAALVAAAAGRVDDIPDVLETDKSLVTQPNRFTIAMARGFAAFQQGRSDEARAALESAQRVVDTSDTSLDREVVHLARGWLLTALGDPDAADVLATARTRLAGFGTRAEGWERVFRMCVGLDADPEVAEHGQGATA
ncbi:MAG: AAA family ATPase [Acidimicrobiia bacterium]|nr:AAA family ATPase [Acidimicrobiia bacterium]